MSKPKSTLDSIWSLLQVTGMDSTNRLAAGVCLGVWLGLMPKSSLLPWSLGILGILSTANLATLAAGFVAGCLAAPLFELVSVPCGEKLLTVDSLNPFFARALDTPVLTHFGFHQPATLGILACGLILMLPTFFGCRFVLGCLQPGLESWLAGGSVQRHRAGSRGVAEGSTASP